MLREKVGDVIKHKTESTNVQDCGGLPRSSVESSVMEEERRG